MQRKKFKWTALKLTGIIFIIFILQFLFKGLTENFMLISSDIYSRPWILITSILLHGSITHLLYNMFALFLFGSLLEKKIGSRNFLIVFFLTGIIASLIASLFYERSLGASGAIYGIMGMLTILQPFMLVWAFGVPMPMIIASILWILMDFAGFTSYLQGTPGGIANAAHLAGIFSGAFFGFFFRFFEKWKRKRMGIIRRLKIKG
ncbi:MAG: rhomboid family intramembrane serine protease [Nanoarchaeota archaeon]|nr:rhomboid family intramembrane serine protease [Nanoarchaeota archaeon]